MATEPEREAVANFGRVARAAPTWLLVIAFAGLAVAFALAGQLDNWFRFAGTIAFAAVTFALIARVAQHREPTP